MQSDLYFGTNFFPKMTYIVVQMEYYTSTHILIKLTLRQLLNSVLESQVKIFKIEINFFLSIV
jgi:hypothetical protein